MANSKKEMQAKAQRRVTWGKQSHGFADWGRVDPLRLLDCLVDVVNAGGALRLGTTRDLQVFAIGIYGDGDPYTIYVRQNEDIYHALQAISAAFTGSTSTTANSGDSPQNG